jgi:HEAT repeat protein
MTVVAMLFVVASVLLAADTVQPEEARLIATLKSESAPPHDKSAACRRLAVIGTKESVPVLAALLADEKLSHMARFALEPMPDPAAGEALRNAMGTLHGKLLVGVINSIGARRDAAATPALSKLLAGGEADTASAAAAALGRIGNSDAAQTLQQALTNGPSGLRTAVADAGLVCAERLLSGGAAGEATGLFDRLRKMELPSHVKMAATRGAILARGTAGVPLLLEQLRSDDAGTCAVGLRVARELPGAAVTKALATEAGKLSEGKQVLVLQALADRGDPAALPAMFEAARGGTMPVRVAAIRGLPRLGGAAVVPVLLEAAAQPEAELAEAAKVSLAGLSGKEVDAALVAAVAQGGTRLRRAAIDTVAERRIAAAVPALLKAAGDADSALRIAAIKGLGATVSASEFRALADLLIQAKVGEELSTAEAAVSLACMRLTDKEWCADQLLSGPSPASLEAKCALVRLLAQLGGAKALQAVRSAAQDSSAPVKDAAIRALADWPDAAAAPDLLQIVRGSDNASHRVLAFRGYVRLSREAQVPADARLKMLSVAMDLARTTDDKKLVLGAFGDVQTIESLRLAARFLSESDLADEAGAAVAKIAGAIGEKHQPESVAALQQVQKSAQAESVLSEARRTLRRLNPQPK